MDDDQYRHLAEQHAAQAEREPVRYRAGLRRFALFGRSFPLLYGLIVLALVAGITALAVSVGGGGLVALKFAWVLIPVVVLAVRSLLVRVPPPDGVTLQEADAPELFRMVRELTRAARTDMPDRIVLVGELNAAVAEVPRLGMLGGFRRHLIIGVPLLAALSPDELRAVIAHELGHVSGRHGREGVLVYRVFEGWRRIMADLQENPGAARPMRRFGEWYLPRLNARAFALRRQQELEADALATELVGPDVAAAALLRVNAAGERMARADRRAWQASIDAGAPPRRATSSAVAALHSEEHDFAERLALAATLLETSSVDEEHPALSDRLRRAGRPVAVLDPEDGTPFEQAIAPLQRTPRPSALEHYLPQETRDSACAALDAESDAALQVNLDAVRGDLARLAQLERDSAALGDRRAQLERLSLARYLRPHEEVSRLAGELAERFPDSPAVCFEQGVARLTAGDEAGVADLARAMSLDPGSIVPASDLLRAYYVATGRPLEAVRLEELRAARAEREQAAARERSTLSDDALLEPHALSRDLEDALREVLAAHGFVEAGYLARVPTKELPEEPLWVLGIRTDGYRDEAVQDLLDEATHALAPAMRGMSDVVLVVIGSDERRGFNRVVGVPDAVVFERQGGEG